MSAFVMHVAVCHDCGWVSRRWSFVDSAQKDVDRHIALSHPLKAVQS